MAVLKGRKKLTKKGVSILIIVASYLLLAIIAAALFLFNANYAEIYGSPSVKDGKVDFAGVDLNERNVACNLAGEWEFFYNKWIITDNYQGKADGMIALPSLWTYRDYGFGRLPKSGYASYRLTVENIQSGAEISVFRYNNNFAYRVFINGELNIESGNMSKLPKETVATGQYEKKLPYRTDGGPLEIVIELSATDAGGLNAAPWLSRSHAKSDEYGTTLRSFTYAALGISTAVLALSILAFLFFRSKKNLAFPLFMCALFVHFLFSKDMIYVTEVPIKISMITELFSFVAVFCLFVFYAYSNGVKIKRALIFTTASVSAICIILLFVFYGTPLAVAFAYLALLSGCAYVVPIALSENMRVGTRTVYSVILVVLASIACFEISDFLGLIVFGTEFIFSFAFMFIIAVFAAMWLKKTAETAKTALKVSRLENELITAKQQALKSQIKPHFIYNSMTAIQARYRSGADDGDRAMESFANYLRSVTDCEGDETVPFEEEIRNVINYFELENLRADGELNLLLDLNFTDFRIPVLSIQPLVENAVRHSGIKNISDGYIQITSERQGSKATVTVIDNGVGFDIADAKGVGLDNTRKRLELFGAIMKIESEIGVGTKIIIEIDAEGENENSSSR